MSKTLITIGRQIGAGGQQIARRIGETLGIPVYGRELIEKAAEKSGFSSQLFEHRDEKRNFWTNFLGGQDYISDEALFKVQSAAIREIAENGSAIFIGRASNYVLRDMHCLYVFVTSPLEMRVARVAERWNLIPEEAAEDIASREKARRKYYDYYTLGTWGDAAEYDLCIDSSILGMDRTADAIIAFGREAGFIV